MIWGKVKHTYAWTYDYISHITCKAIDMMISVLIYGFTYYYKNTRRGKKDTRSTESIRADLNRNTVAITLRKRPLVLITVFILPFVAPLLLTKVFTISRLYENAFWASLETGISTSSVYFLAIRSILNLLLCIMYGGLYYISSHMQSLFRSDIQHSLAEKIKDGWMRFRTASNKSFSGRFVDQVNQTLDLIDDLSESLRLFTKYVPDIYIYICTIYPFVGQVPAATLFAPLFVPALISIATYIILRPFKLVNNIQTVASQKLRQTLSYTSHPDTAKSLSCNYTRNKLAELIEQDISSASSATVQQVANMRLKRLLSGMILFSTKCCGLLMTLYLCQFGLASTAASFSLYYLSLKISSNVIKFIDSFLSSSSSNAGMLQFFETTEWLRDVECVRAVDILDHQSDDTVVNIDNHTIKAHDKTILDTSSIELKKQNRYLIIGESMAGKSTLFDLIYGMIPQDTPAARSCGLLTTDKPTVYSRLSDITLMRQQILVPEDMQDTLLDFMCYPLELNDKTADELTQIKLHASEYLRIYKDLERHADNLNDKFVITKFSEGQKQRLRNFTLVLNPDHDKFLLLDEVCSKQDRDTEKLFMNYLLENHKGGFAEISHKHPHTLPEGRYTHVIKVNRSPDGSKVEMLTEEDYNAQISAPRIS